MWESNLPSLGGGIWIDSPLTVGCCTCLTILRSARGRNNRRRRMLNRNMPRWLNLHFSLHIYCERLMHRIFTAYSLQAPQHTDEYAFVTFQSVRRESPAPQTLSLRYAVRNPGSPSFLSTLVQGIEGRRRARRCASVDIDMVSCLAALGLLASGSLLTVFTTESPTLHLE